MPRESTWQWLFNELDALEFLDTWLVPWTRFEGRDHTFVAKNYSEHSGRNVRYLSIDEGIVYIRVDRPKAGG